MYNVSKAVGNSRPNLPEDVKLIQTLFRAHQDYGDPHMAGIPPVTATGAYTPDLGSAILKYQKNLNSTSREVWPDGIVDPLPSRSGYEGDWDVYYGSGVKSTLAYLCYHLFMHDRARYFRIGDELRLDWVPELPASS